MRRASWPLIVWRLLWAPFLAVCLLGAAFFILLMFGLPESRGFWRENF